nr:hypothetical protein [Acidobacteriota bacterium]NIQ86906.1 hypothetical protein [Acidobacteriota bacterium]
VIPDPRTEVLASYRWDLSRQGSDKLRRLGLPARFPAITRNRSDDGTPAYYFAGDFGDSTVGGARVPLAGFVSFRRFIEKARRIPSHQAFYYRFYVPLMTRILASAEESR